MRDTAKKEMMTAMSSGPLVSVTGAMVEGKMPAAAKSDAARNIKSKGCWDHGPSPVGEI
jgi:hypothetical protein